jgi:hypothetical protein
MTTAIVAAYKSVLGGMFSTQILELAKVSRGLIEELVVTEDSRRPDRPRHAITKNARGSTRIRSHCRTSRRQKKHSRALNTPVNMQALYEGNDPFASFGEVLATMHKN